MKRYAWIFHWDLIYEEWFWWLFWHSPLRKVAILLELGISYANNVHIPQGWQCTTIENCQAMILFLFQCAGGGWPYALKVTKKVQFWEFVLLFYYFFVSHNKAKKSMFIFEGKIGSAKEWRKLFLKAGFFPFLEQCRVT